MTDILNDEIRMTNGRAKAHVGSCVLGAGGPRPDWRSGSGLTQRTKAGANIQRPTFNKSSKHQHPTSREIPMSKHQTNNSPCWKVPAALARCSKGWPGWAFYHACKW